jgi:quercetin 2,3-dioxygenase
MITVRKSAERGKSDREWLVARPSFSFGPYQDPRYNGFRSLRVLNDDRIAPGKGFGPHAHRDMEIITYVVEGRILHRDSLGGRYIVRPNEVQTMSAGDGVVHSEFNESETESLRVLQIWIQPSAEDLQPAYQQISFDPHEKQGQFRLLAAPESSDQKQWTVINQDARLYVAAVEREQRASYAFPPTRHGWVQVVSGRVSLNQIPLEEGDGAAISDEGEVVVEGADAGEILLFDLA